MTPFLKMHGLGNDFAVFDARNRALALDSQAARAIADRRLGVGCDQVIVIEKSLNGADAAMRIFNADGGEVESCGNAARCVARLLMDENGKSAVRLDSEGGALTCGDARGLVTVDMGAPKFGWREIPLAREVDTNCFSVSLPPPLAGGGNSVEHSETELGEGFCDTSPLPRVASLRAPSRKGRGESESELEEAVQSTAAALSSVAAVNVGNPHCVLFVQGDAPVETLGPAIERHPMFPERTNVEFVQVLASDRLRMKVWERGAGITMACGTGACAAVAAAQRRGLCGAKVEVVLDGGALTIEWAGGEAHIFMTGPTALSYRGEIDLEALR